MRVAWIFIAGLTLRLALIARFPLVFGGDPMIRMLHPDRILASHQLPLLQIVIALVSRLTTNYLAILVAMAVIGAAVGVAFYLLAREFFDERVAFLAGLLMTTDPLVAAHSIVPYQESLMLVCVLLAFYFFYAERYGVSSMGLALGCITRFEAWIAAPVLAAAYVWKHERRAWAVVKGLALFGWAPVAWMLFRGGLAPEGSYVIESTFTLRRLVRWAYLGYITVKFTPVIVVALGLAGLWFLWRERDRWVPRLWPLILFFLMFSVALLFSAHGVRDDPDGKVASREAHFWIAAVVLLAAIALEKVPKYQVALAGLGIAFGVWGTYQYVAREDSDPRLQLSYRVAKFFDGALQPGQRALILSPPWDRQFFDFYLQRARETGGETRYQAAVRNLAENTDTSPPDYQRMLIHSRLDRSQLLNSSAGCTEWVAVWSDFSPPPQDVPAPIEVLRAGDLSVRISQRVCPK
ncbi:MAG TPA: glycosyltransferase family 39 protein [Bryobacteraceae bacterium]|nr:glycosyltransferase family 39 protein [Bryobacteraceae bacterium]